MLHIEDLLQIDTRQGTNNQHTFSHGNCLPYTGVPFGMNHFVVQTADQRGSWYFNPHDRTFQGIRLTHQPSPWMGDFSQLLLAPTAGHVVKSDLFHHQSSYRTEEAVFSPFYLKVKQERYQITTEFSPTTYGGVLQSRYLKNSQPGLFIRSQGPSEIAVDVANKTVRGYITNASGSEDKDFKMYFTLRFDQAIDAATTGYYTDDALVPSTTYAGTDPIFDIRFPAAETLTTHLATSFLSQDQADLNLSRIENDSFDTIKQAAADKWLSYLNKIEIENRNKEQIKTFYACLYRTCLFPQKFYELDEANQPQHYNTLAKKVQPGYLYTNNGFWDTYKTVYPLYSLIAHEEYEEMLQGYLQSYREAGFLPKWLSPDERGMMPGTLIDAVIADAAVKGLATDLMPEFLEGMLAGATTKSASGNYGRRGTLDYLKYGYVPLDYHESVNHTLDYAYSDFCISQVARVLGKGDIQATYQKQSRNFLNIFDENTGFMRAKDKEGNFRHDFKHDRWGLDYAEGSTWQNGFATYHDFAALIAAYGGERAFFDKLTTLCNTPPTYGVEGYGFEIHEMSEMAAVDFGQVALSNQPSFHLPYLFNYVGKPASTQVVVKQLMTELFNAGWDGFPGDEDNGSMSGWYIFSSLGFYPVCPGSGEYVLGIPLFDKATVHLANGKTLVVEAAGNQAHTNFVSEVALNETPHTALAIQHESLMAGGNLKFTMALAPVDREYSNAEKPFSLTTNH